MILLLLFTYCFAQLQFDSSVNVTASTDLMLQLANLERSIYCSKQLMYNNQLAVSAQLRSEQCGSEVLSIVGENIFAATFAYVRPHTAMTVWLYERANFDCLAHSVPDSSNRNYMQLVAANVTSMGCGASKCRSTGSFAQTLLVVVCHFDVSIDKLAIIVDDQYCGGTCATTTTRKQNMTTVGTTITTTPTTTPTQSTITTTPTLMQSTSTTTPTLMQSTSTTTPTLMPSTSTVATIPIPSTSTTQSTISVMTSTQSTTQSTTPATQSTTPATQSTTSTTPTTAITLTETNSTTVSTKPPSTVSPTITRGTDGCTLLRDLCWEKCGSPIIFPFQESCMTGFDGNVLKCVSPPGCVCEVPVELQSYGASIDRCDMGSCDNTFEGSNPGSLGWCKTCGYNCGNYQSDCFTHENFCKRPGRCSRLNMCARWREKNCGDINDYTCGMNSILDDSSINGTSAKQYGDSLGWLIAFIVLVLVVVIAVVIAYIYHMRRVDKISTDIEMQQNARIKRMQQENRILSSDSNDHIASSGSGLGSGLNSTDRVISVDSRSGTIYAGTSQPHKNDRSSRSARSDRSSRSTIQQDAFAEEN